MERVKSPETGAELYVYNSGETIIKEGQGSSIIYILKRGTLGVYKGDNKINEIKGSGVVFGEMSSILGKPRTVTLKAEVQSEVMVYRGGIEGIIRRFPSITKKILVVLAERLESQTVKYSALQSKCAFLNKQLKEAKEKIDAQKQKEDELLTDTISSISSDLLEDTGDSIEYIAIPPKKRK